ncbi:MAG: RpiB/LacA/LacB family sugar-phosphate isomerase [Parcubacteria group bacterium]|nr:RpiB/LacA/LacB family sugar-phosphate isomerase [Parcubacteria group bacterium]
MIYLGADHAGFSLKEKIKAHLEKARVRYADLGAFAYDNDDDYPEYAVLVAKKVAKDPKARGILVCGTGNGMAIAANKTKGVRAAVAWDSYSAKKAVQDDAANILALPARDITEQSALAVVTAYLSEKPSAAARHTRRVHKIRKLER